MPSAVYLHDGEQQITITFRKEEGRERFKAHYRALDALAVQYRAERDAAQRLLTRYADTLTMIHAGLPSVGLDDHCDDIRRRIEATRRAARAVVGLREMHLSTDEAHEIDGLLENPVAQPKYAPLRLAMRTDPSPDAELLAIVREIAAGDDGIYPADGERYCRFCDGLESTRWHVDPAGNRGAVREIAHRGDCLWMRARQIVARLDGGKDVLHLSRQSLHG